MSKADGYQDKLSWDAAVCHFIMAKEGKPLTAVQIDLLTKDLTLHEEMEIERQRFAGLAPTPDGGIERRQHGSGRPGGAPFDQEEDDR